MTAQQMHDIRNYVQSLTQSIENFSIYDKKKLSNQLSKKTQNQIQEQNHITLNNKKENSDDNQNEIKNFNNIESKDYSQIQDNLKSNYESLINKDNNNLVNFQNQQKSSMASMKINQIKGIKKQESKISSKLVNIQKQIDKKIINTDSKDTDNNKQDKILKPYTLDLDISFENDSILHQDNEEIKIVNNDNILKTINKEFNSKIQNLVNYSKSHYELLKITKFIIQKINFLYHVNLSFEKNQPIKIIDISPHEILSQISKMMQILFINKLNHIILTLRSKIKNINIDIHMFKYLVCHIILKLHQKKFTNIELVIDFDQQYSNEFDEQINLINIVIIFNLDNDIKIYSFENSEIFKSIVNNIGNRLTQNYELDSKNLTHKLNIEQTNYDEKLEKLDFQKQVTIKNDKIIKVNDPNLLIYSDKQIEMNDGCIYLNIDDEINIQSMHSLIFSRLNITLYTSRSSEELIQDLMTIYTEQVIKQSCHPTVIVILDHVLDGKQGLEVLEEAREIEERFGLNISQVLLSSTEDDSVKHNYKNAGVKQHISKPLTKNKVKSLLEQIGKLKNGENLKI